MDAYGGGLFYQYTSSGMKGKVDFDPDVEFKGEYEGMRCAGCILSPRPFVIEIDDLDMDE